MNNRGSHPDASEKWRMVVRWYRSQIKPDGSLPSVRTAAAILNVSTRTVRLAVQALRLQGWLESHPGKGLWRTGHAPEKKQPPPMESSPYRWKNVAASLQNALQQADFADMQRLPGAKELALRFHCSQPTLRKALKQLEAQGILVRNGSRWALRSTHSSARRKLLVVAAHVAGSIRMETFREIDFFRCAEEEALAHDLELQVIGYDDAQERFLHGISGNPETDVGVLFSPWHLQNAAECLRRILEWRLPVSVWLENSEESLSHHYHARRSGLAFFSIGYGEEPGVVAGRYLQSRGHSRVSYISAFHGSEWSQARLRGLERILKNVQVLTETGYRNPWTFRDQVESSPLGQADAQDLLPLVAEGLNASLTRLRLAQWREATCELARDGAILQVLQPLLRQALSTPGITVWVFANDLCAILAQGQLKEWNIARSQWPAMIAFDNSPEAFIHALDSYEFNTRGMVRSMIHHVLSPRNPLYKTRKILKPEGHVVSRSVQKKLF